MTEPAGKFTILIVDDSEDFLDLLEVTFGRQYDLKRATDGRSALRVAFEKPRPDLILLDVEMPGSSGYDVCRAIKASPALADVPVIFLTQRSEAEDVVQGFQLGAIDYFPKPINPPVLAARIRAHVELITRRGQQEEIIRVRTTQLEHTRVQLIRRLGRAMEYHETTAVGNRVVRLGHYARHLAEAAGARPAVCDLIMKAAPLHDIGKLGVPAQILRKFEALSAPERDQMQRHPEIGAEIIGEHDDPLLKLARTLALTHHERWDGTGYPAGLRGDAIPWPGRVMAVVDAFEAMTATQFHHQPMPLDLAANEILRGSGKQFDPQMVEAFRKALPAFRKVRETYADALGDLLNLDFLGAPAKAPAPEAAAGPTATQHEAAIASALQEMRESDEARAGVLAGAQARLKVERDLIAAAAKDVSTQQAARKRAEEAGAREAEAMGLSRRRIAEEAAAARVAQERAKAEAKAAFAARQAERALAQALAEAEARVAAEQALAAAALERKQADEALAKTTADLAARETEAQELARRRSADEADARAGVEQPPEVSAATEQRAADDAAAKAATESTLAAERAALALAEDALKEAQQALLAREQALAQAERALAQRALAEHDPAVQAALPVRHGKLRTVLYAAVLMAAVAAAAKFYLELQTRPAESASQSAPAPAVVTASEPGPIRGISEGAPLKLRLDVEVERVTRPERVN